MSVAELQAEQDSQILADITLFPKQQELRELVEDNSKKIITIGGSRGGTKSSGIQRIQLIRRIKWPGTRGLILRRKYKELLENHITPFFNDFPRLRKYYNVSDKTLTLPNTSAIVFWHAETFRDLKSLQGAGFMDVAVDEATHFAQEELEWLLGIRREKGIPDGLCKTIYSCNPGDIGHAYIQRIAVEGTKDRTLYRENENPDEYAFIQTFGWDNAFWAEGYLKSKGLTFDDYYELSEAERIEIYTRHTDYGRTMWALPESLRPGWFYGRWDKFKGQYFSNFIRERHVGEPRPGGQIACKANGKVYQIQPHWPKWISMDWGFADDSAIHWHTTADDGRHITYREWVVNNTTALMLGTGILERSVDAQGRKEKIEQFFLSPDAFQDRTGQSTIAEQLRESACLGDRIPYPAQASDDRVGGWQLLYQLFEKDGLLISENCPVLIAALPTLVRFGYGEPGSVEDIKPSPVDHAPDSERYGLYSRLGAARVPSEVRALERVAEIQDPTDRARILNDFWAKEHKKNQPIPVLRRHGVRKKFGF